MLQCSKRMDFTIKYNQKFIIILLISLGAALSWGANVKDDFTTERAKQIIKLSKAFDIKNLLNTEVDPCNDFHSYSCGRWGKINPAAIMGEYETSKFGHLSAGIEGRLYEFMKKGQPGNDSKENKIQAFYQSCRRTKTDKTQYRLALQKVYREFGQFSFLKTKEQLKRNDFNWWSTIAKIKKIYGKSIIISVNIMDDVKNNSRTRLYLGAPSFSMTQSAVNEMSVVRANEVKTNLKLFFEIDDAEASKVANELLDFEYSLSAGSTDVREGKSIEDLSSLYNTSDVKQNFIDLFDVEKFLQIVLGTNELPGQIYLYDEHYVENLIEVFNSTETRIVENYILWLLLQEYAVVDEERRSIDVVCMEKSKKYFGQFHQHVIYQSFRNQQDEDDVYELWHFIKAQFRDNLIGSKYNWMSNTTREQAIEKLDNMNLTINSYDDVNFEEFFKNLNMDSTNYVLNLQNILKHIEASRENKVEFKSEGIEDAETTAYTPVYNIFTNQIKIPVAMLQPYHIWNRIYPKAIHYATLGFLIAHELIHGFDDEGRDYDANGTARSWWDEQSAEAFEERRQCFQDQYHSYIYAGQPLPNFVVQSENIADNAGLKLSYAAYVRWLAKQKQGSSNVEASDTLPRLPFNNRELFFISFAQLWCADTHVDFRNYFANNDIHAPPKFRVIGSLANMPEFAWIWKCKNESLMVSKHMCEIY